MSALCDLTFPELVALNTRLLADCARVSMHGWTLLNAGDMTSWDVNQAAARDILTAAAQVRDEMTRRTTP